MGQLGQALVFVICFVIVAAVLIHLWPDAQPWIQNLTGGNNLSNMKALMP